jgi:ArsR family transcriptional regulator, arsenate/arsenite/antimonite-responsive transcriptional repressor
MGKSKTDFFSEKQNRLANFTKALGHPARVAIAEHLIENGSSNCGNIVEKLPLAQPTISQHLKERKTAGLIKRNQQGSGTAYSVNQKAFSKFEKQIKSLFKKAKKMKNFE